MSTEEETTETPSANLKSEVAEKQSFPPLRSDEVITESPPSELATHEMEGGKAEFYTEEDSQLQIEQPRSEFATLTTSSINISSPRSSEVTAVGAAEQQIASKIIEPTTSHAAPISEEIPKEQHITAIEISEPTTLKDSQEDASPPPQKKTFSAKNIIARLCRKIQISARNTTQPEATAQAKTKDKAENISH